MSRGIQEEFGQPLNIFDDQGLTEASLCLRSVTAVRLPSAPPCPFPHYKLDHALGITDMDLCLLTGCTLEWTLGDENAEQREVAQRTYIKV